VCVCSLRYPACNAYALYYIVICGLPGSTIFFHIHKKFKIFYKKPLLNTRCVFWFSLQIFVCNFFILRRAERDMIKKVTRSSCKVPFILNRFQWNLNFANRFSKNTQIPSFMKIRPVRTELFYADWRTDRRRDITQLIVPFRNSANGSKKLD
jgi:hypothetical protein